MPYIHHKLCPMKTSGKWIKDCIKKNLLSGIIYQERCASFREVQAGRELCNGKLNYPDLQRVPARSTLSDSNKKGNSEALCNLSQATNSKYKRFIAEAIHYRSRNKLRSPPYYPLSAFPSKQLPAPECPNKVDLPEERFLIR